MDCLHEIRETLTPEDWESGTVQALPSRITRPLQDILPLHLFLTLHERPPHSTGEPPPDEPPAHVLDEADTPRAAALAERHAFVAGASHPPPTSPPATPAAVSDVPAAASAAPHPDPPAPPAAPTPQSTRPYFPIGHRARHFAHLDGSILADMVSLARTEEAKKIVSVNNKSCHQIAFTKERGESLSVHDGV